MWRNEIVGFLRVPGVEPREGGVFLGNPKDSRWEDLGNLREGRGESPPGTRKNRILLESTHVEE